VHEGLSQQADYPETHETQCIDNLMSGSIWNLEGHEKSRILLNQIQGLDILLLWSITLFLTQQS